MHVGAPSQVHVVGVRWIYAQIQWNESKSHDTAEKTWLYNTPAPSLICRCTPNVESSADIIEHYYHIVLADFIKPFCQSRITAINVVALMLVNSARKGKILSTLNANQ